METQPCVVNAVDEDSQAECFEAKVNLAQVNGAKRVFASRTCTRRISRLRRKPRVRSLSVVARLAAVASAFLVIGLITIPSTAYAAEASVGLGTSAAFSVLGSSTVTNTGPSTLSNDLGVSPGTAITGFPPGKAGGATYQGDAQAAQARSDLTIGYNDAASRAPTDIVAGDLVGKNLTSGVYKSNSSLALSGTLTLNGQGNPDAVFIFQVASTLVTASSSKVSMINDAQACNVFWQVGSSATLGTDSAFDGTIMALASVTVTTDTVVTGRALARNGAVTLDDDTFLSPACKTSTPPTTTTTTATTTATTTTPPTTQGGSVGGVGGSGGVGSTGPTGPVGVAVGGAVPSGIGGFAVVRSPTGKFTLAQTGFGPVLQSLLAIGIMLILLGGSVLAVSRTRARRLQTVG
jgi:Ice-binding-like